MATEKRLIDANALMEETVWKCGGDPYDQYYMGYQDALDNVEVTIENQTTVDAVEVMHGRWKYYHKQNIAVCTNCSFERDLDANFGKAVSCPNCGAKMDENENP